MADDLQSMLYESKISSVVPTAIGSLTREEFDRELQEGIDSIKDGKKYSSDEVDEILAEEFGI